MDKLIHLTNGGFTVVDDFVYNSICRFTWSSNNCGYVQGWIDGKHCLLHRHLVGAVKGQEVDHINRDKRDNRLVNLRIVDRLTNLANVEYLAEWEANSREAKRLFASGLSVNQVAKAMKCSHHAARRRIRHQSPNMTS